MDPQKLKSRCVGTIVGFAVGDSLGMPAEFLSREQIRRYYGKPIAGFLKAHPGHASDFLPPGSYTDNTQTMLATAECLIECRKMDPARTRMRCFHGSAILCRIGRPRQRTCKPANICRRDGPGTKAVFSAAGVEAIDRQWLTGVENSDVLIGVGENLADLLGRPNSEAALP